MKPIHLEIQAFGAFVEKQTLDFRRLEQHRIFLIHGQTGAGKSTIFDAICFALYGETSGIRDAGKMRSELASANLDTMVKFRFELKGKEYIVQRVIKVSTQGNENEKIQFYQTEVDSDKEIGLVLTKKSEIKEYVISLLGLKPDEFKQLVLLPQGKFQELLHASSKDKTALLKNIFNTSEFEQLTYRLKDKAQESKNALKQATDAQQTLIVNSGFEDWEDLLENIKQKTAELAVQKIEEGVAKTSLEEAHKNYEKAKSLMDDLLERRKLEIRKNELLASKQDIEASEHKLARSQSAMQLEDSLKALQKAQADIQLKAQGIDKLKTEIVALEHSLDLAKATLESAKAKALELPQLRTDLNTWQSYLPMAQSLAEQQEILQKLSSEETQARTETENITEKIVGVKDIIGKSSSEQPLLIAEVAKIESLEAEVERIRAIGTQKKELETKSADLEQLKTLCAKYLNAFDNAQKEERKSYEGYDSLLNDWRLHQAARLALDLVADAPCPVCGSTTHPKKAVSGEHGLVTDQVLESAKKTFETKQAETSTARTTYEQSKAPLEKLELEISVINGAIGEQYRSIDLADFRLQFTNADNNLKKARAAKLTLEKLNSDIEKFKTELESLEKALSEGQIKLASATQNKAVKSGELAQLESRLPQVARDKANVESKIKVLETAISDAEKSLQTAQQQVETASQKMVAAQATLATEIQNQAKAESDFKTLNIPVLEKTAALGFENTSEAQNALLDEVTRTKLASKIEQWKLDTTSNNAKLETLTPKTEGKQEPDLSSIESALEAAKLKATDLNKAIGNADAQIAQMKNLQAALQKLQKERETLLKDGADIIRMSELALGNNAYKQPFDTYVVGILLEQVLLFANTRLSTLSDGRYSLVRSEEVAGGGFKGLELCVNDTYTGKQRDVKNLSGGETFFTSLALALGLADYTSARNGGIKLEALFIDEGFGSLSGNYLEKAINVLMEDSENRLIGLISHVSELQERFKNQCVEVRKTETGSIIEY